MIRIFLVLVLISSAVSFKAFAADEGYDEAKEAEIAQKAKKRLYPGGRDEGDLKVQAQVATPARKFAPQAEIKNEEPAEE